MLLETILIQLQNKLDLKDQDGGNEIYNLTTETCSPGLFISVVLGKWSQL